MTTGGTRFGSRIVSIRPTPDGGRLNQTPAKQPLEDGAGRCGLNGTRKNGSLLETRSLSEIINAAPKKDMPAMAT
jgi:hypothetical protein